MNLQKQRIYKYKEADGSQPLCIYMGSSQNNNGYIIVPLVSESTNSTIKLNVTRQYASPDYHKSIKKHQFISPLYINGQYTDVSYEIFKQISHSVINSKLNYIDTQSQQADANFMDFNKIFDFLDWKSKKLSYLIDDSPNSMPIYENGIYWVDLGYNVGSELNKARPALIWKKRLDNRNSKHNSYIVIPITSKDSAKKYYMNVEVKYNNKTCYMKVEDMKRVHHKRIYKPVLDNKKDIVYIDNETRQRVLDAIQKFYIYNNKYHKER